MTLKSPEYICYRCGTSAGPSIYSTAAIYSAAFQRADKEAVDKEAADKLKKEQA